MPAVGLEHKQRQSGFSPQIRGFPLFMRIIGFEKRNKTQGFLIKISLFLLTSAHENAHKKNGRPAGRPKNKKGVK